MAARFLRSFATLVCAMLLLPGFVQPSRAQGYSLSNAWAVAATGNTNGLPETFIGTGNLDRGLAYNAASNHVIMASRSGGNGAHVFDAATGLYLTSLDMTGVSGGSIFSWNLLAAADDGVVYGFNLSQTTFKIYLWTNYFSPPHVAFFGDPSSGLLSSFRTADAVTVRGTGTNTQILVGTAVTGAATNAFLFSTTNGFDFTSTLINIPGIVSGDTRFGLAFYTNNTFLAKQNGQPLRLIQYPADATSQQSVTATVLASVALPGNEHVIAYEPTTKLLAAITANNPARVALYNVSTLASPVFLSTNQFATGTANGNLTGALVFGGPGKTNNLYALWSNNGILASKINFTSEIVAPSISGQPVGGTIYTNSPLFTLTVGASGSSPLSYQWRFNSNNIAGATNGSYSLSLPATSASGYYDVLVSNAAGSTNSNPALVTVIAPTTSSVVTQLWSLATGSRPYVDNNYGTRGLAYDTNTATVLLSSRATTSIYVLDANSGADLFTLNTLGISGGTFALNLVGVADDGVVYAGNLARTANGDIFFLYRWPSVSASEVPAYAYSGGDPGNGSGERWGDTLAVRGAGAGTQILLGSLNGNNVVLFTTTDGQNFSPTLIPVPDAPNGFAGLGIAFGAGNTFWAKNIGYDLRQVAFDPVGATASVIQQYVAPAQIPSSMTGIAVDTANNLLAGVVVNDNPRNLRFYQLSGDANPPTLFHQAFLPSHNPDVQGNAAVAMKNGRAYALEVNNGIVASSYGVPPPPLAPFGIISVSAQGGPAVVLTWQSVSTRSYQVQYKDSLSDAMWIDAGSPIVASGTTTSYTNSVIGTSTRYYRISGQ